MWVSIYHRRIYGEVRAGQRLEWKNLVCMIDGQGDWIIGRRREVVLEGVPEDPSEVGESVDGIKESILRKWRRYQP